MLGVAQGTVRLADYDPQWPVLATAECARLRDGLGALIQDLEHIGSTAVSALPSKPILDLALCVASADAFPALARGLVGLGYVAKGEHGLPGRQFFTLGEPVTHHVHAVAAGSPHWVMWLRFRDHLRGHTADRRAYADCKRRLAAAHPRDRSAYTKGKDELVRSILARAQVSRERPG